ncbi:TetR family transcriptional regulator [Amycolatopsis antarctica]|uniref:TetR family transcriptional regulator n=1 Tax=Amycolatopsis antarctica TaxID=1854586 RepID=A0A263CVV8_9PSEU|nr:TetR family transcriptional regulator [Amycolatopsis antarctica]OZM70253.1 TetR family transcriptional regulator [Amycolatopsis antarctica]
MPTKPAESTAAAAGPGVPEPATRQERKQRTRRALLDAALELLADRGFGSLSLREVTKLAGIVPTAFYRHFTSMEELGITLVDESMRSLRAMMRAARSEPAASSDAIRASVTTLHEHVRAQEDHFRFLTRERYGGSGAVQRAIGTELRLFGSELAVDLARFEGFRAWSTEDLHMMADLIVTAMLATVLELIESRPRDDETDRRIMRTAENRLRLLMLGVPHWRSRR